MAALLPLPARAADYYVDAAAGDDLAPGSRGAPWKSLWRVARAKLAPGDRVLLRSGQVFRGQLRLDVSGAPGRPIVFTAFGDGPPPSLRGAEERGHASDWADAGGGVWYLAGLARDPVVLAADARPGRRVATRQALEGPWDHFYDPQLGRLYVKAADNPARLARMVEIGAHDFVVGPIKGSHLAFEGLAFSLPRLSTVLAWGADDLTFSACTFTSSPVNHVQLHHGSGRVLIQDSRFDDWNLLHDAAYAVQAIAGSGPVDVLGCTFTATLQGGGRDHAAIMSDLQGFVRRVSGCRFEGGDGRLADEGVVIWRPDQRADAVTITDNVFEGLGGVAIILQETGHFGARPLIRVAGNRIRGAVLGRDLDKEAVRVRETAGAKVVVEGNSIEDTAHGPYEHDGISADAAPGVVVRANSVRGAHTGLRIGGGSTGAQVLGNRLTDNRGYGLRVLPGSALAEQRDNCLWGNALGPVSGTGLGPGDSPHPLPANALPCASAP